MQTHRDRIAAAAGAPLIAGAAAAGHPGRVRTGFEVLADRGFAELAGQRIGMIANPTAVRPDLRHEVDVLAAESTVDLVAVFGPEHGFRGTAQAGEGEDFSTDPKTGLPVYNAYKDAGKMAGFFTELELDTVVFDIQDAGARFYTYIWTMYLALEAAAATGVRFVILDRPNPHGRPRAEGPVLHPEYASSVGLKPIAQQHAMTVGELGRLFNGEFTPAAAGTGADLTVVEMRGWRRDMSYEDTRLPWIAPSPNIPTVDTAVAYPGTGLFEATKLSEGRGTTKPFELIGAPGIDHRWEEALTAARLPGVRFREAYFKPTFSKCANETCGGVELVVTDRAAFDPIRTALEMIISARRLFPQHGWIPPRESAEPYWIDKLTGSDAVRTAIEAGASATEVAEGWRADLDAFAEVRKRYLLYP